MKKNNNNKHSIYFLFVSFYFIFSTLLVSNYLALLFRPFRLFFIFAHGKKCILHHIIVSAFVPLDGVHQGSPFLPSRFVATA